MNLTARHRSLQIGEMGGKPPGLSAIVKGGKNEI
jgi:hypothetical protein